MLHKIYSCNFFFFFPLFQCQLYESGLSDHITLNVDPSGEVIGVSLSTSTGQCTGNTMPDEAISSWNTTVEIIQTVPGPVQVLKSL